MLTAYLKRETTRTSYYASPAGSYLDEFTDWLARCGFHEEVICQYLPGRLVAIKSFMRFIEHRVPAILEQSRRILAIPAKRTDTRLISYLSLDEMQALLNTPDIED